MWFYLAIVSFRVETIIPSGFISSTAFIKLVYYRSPNEPMPRINATFTIDNIVFFESIGVIDQTLILIEATLYCQEWSCSNIIPTIDKNIVYLYNLEYWSISSIISSEWSSCVFTVCHWICLSFIYRIGLMNIGM